MPYITANNLSIGYDGKEIIENINFTVNKGDYLYIVGENGTGKSTLMKTLLGLIPAIGGKMEFSPEVKNEIGYLPQQTEVQKDFPASVEEIVLSGCQRRMGFLPFYTKAEKAIAYENMDYLHVLELKNKCYRELSGGQQQRVLLARALCATKKILLLDEPVTGLDPKVTIEMYELIKRLNDEGITIIMISHDVKAAVKYADHILHIGSKLFFGTKDEYLNSKVGKNFLAMEGDEQDGNI
ncbi:MAG: ABC transporter ATP-binding protein [Lachnospiraceae bacterium]|nr:ABC transporter ATP-binding protein [Lachnospiraceae bacterium]